MCLACLSPDQAVRVRARLAPLAGDIFLFTYLFYGWDIVLCSWARHFASLYPGV